MLFRSTLPEARGDTLADSAGALVAHLARRRAGTGLGDDWLVLTTDPALTGAVDSLARGRVDGAVTHWMGRGPGLTPSGDDVLMGMLAALRFSGALDPSSLLGLGASLEAAARRLTTEISAEHLRHACRGMVAGPIRDLLVALDGGDTDVVSGAVDRLGRYGHTSGMDSTLGVVMGLLGPDAPGPTPPRQAVRLRNEALERPWCGR